MSELPPPPPEAPRHVETSGKAVASLVLGITGGLGVGSILAIIYGRKAKKEIAQSNGWLKGKLLAAWGVALGWIGVGLAIVGVGILINGAVREANEQRKVDEALQELWENGPHFTEPGATVPAGVPIVCVGDYSGAKTLTSQSLLMRSASASVRGRQRHQVLTRVSSCRRVKTTAGVRHRPVRLKTVVAGMG
jgi:hypothetical protein